MKVFRAIGLGIILWLLIFIEVGVLLFALEFSPSSDAYYVSHFVFLVFFSLFVNLAYFWGGNKVRGGFLAGFGAGLLFLLTSIILDALITVPFFVKDYGFFLRTEILLGMAVVLVISSLVGMARR